LVAEHVCAHCRCTNSAAHRLTGEKLTVLQLFFHPKAGTAVLGNPSTLPPREEELVQLLPQHLLVLVHTSVSQGRVCSFFHMVVLASNFHMSFVVSSFMGDISRARTI